MIHVLNNQNLLDWFDTQTDTGIVHQANCFHTMGAGIARQIRDRYPEAYTADKLTKYGDKEKLGSFSVTLVKNSQNRFVYNLYSQFHYGGDMRNTSYDAMVDGLERIKTNANMQKLKRIGVPYNIGCKLGGGNWAIVKAILQEAFNEVWTDIDLYICRYEP